jgi:hypothetical protein
VFKFSISTLHDHVIGKHLLNVGHPTLLSEEEEAYIVHAIIFCADNGWPWNRKDVSAMIGDFFNLTNRIVPWKDHPGKKFMQNFEKRWAG